MDENQEVLFVVRSLRDFHGKKLRHTSWFWSKESAQEHAEWVKDGRGEVLSVAEYKLLGVVE